MTNFYSLGHVPKNKDPGLRFRERDHQIYVLFIFMKKCPRRKCLHKEGQTFCQWASSQFINFLSLRCKHNYLFHLTFYFHGHHSLFQIKKNFMWLWEAAEIKYIPYNPDLQQSSFCVFITGVFSLSSWCSFVRRGTVQAKLTKVVLHGQNLLAEYTRENFWKHLLLFQHSETGCLH